VTTRRAAATSARPRPSAPARRGAQDRGADKDEEQWALSRFVPMVQELVEDLATGALSPDDYPPVRAPAARAAGAAPRRAWPRSHARLQWPRAPACEHLKVAGRGLAVPLAERCPPPRSGGAGGRAGEGRVRAQCALAVGHQARGARVRPGGVGRLWSQGAHLAACLTARSSCWCCRSWSVPRVRIRHHSGCCKSSPLG